MRALRSIDGKVRAPSDQPGRFPEPLVLTRAQAASGPKAVNDEAQSCTETVTETICGCDLGV